MDQRLAGTLGVDLGSVNVKATWLQPEREVAPAYSAPARGRPLAALEGMLTGALGGSIGPSLLRLSLTGTAQSLIAAAVPATRTNEVVATALAVASAHPGTRTVIDVGGQFTKWILLDRDRVADFAINGLCAAGSGAFLEQQAARLKLSAKEMGALAATADRGATVAGRCSVFAKSDMIHLQQKGTPVEEIAYGVCLALVRTFVATVLGGRRVEPPVVLVGGGGANPGLVRAFTEVLELRDGDVTVPSDHLTVGSRGAALAVARSEEREQLTLEKLLGHLKARASARARFEGPATQSLPRLQRWAEPGQRPDEDLPREALGPPPYQALLGVDVGSVSTNLVVLAPEGQVLQGIYLPTRGRPIEVLNEALSMVEAKFGDDLSVLAVGATGSGRHLAARALGADTVKNEITAQMASAVHYFPEVDTVFEIGGQDSKYIGARDGRLASFEMNKICAAGTGSFLEEQAERLGVSIREEFAALALGAEAPRDLGSRCTVFMDTELVRAQQMDVSPEDICAGLSYSIARNYLEKVVAQRPVGKRVVFQGGTASNDAVVAAMRALTGAQIVVHPYNRISGAIGAALLADRSRQRAPKPSEFRGYGACRDAKRRSFECGRCSNRCQVIKVEIGGRTSHFGDTCERYSARDGSRGSHRQAAAKPRDLFAERHALLEDHLPPRRPGRLRAVLPRASHILELAPLWATILDDLGFDVALTPPGALDQIAKGGRGLPSEFCLPIKITAGQTREALNLDHEAQVVLPSVLELPDPTGDGQTHPCLFSQELPNILRKEEGARIVTPQASLSKTRGGLREAEAELIRVFGASRRRARRALRRGLKVQERFDQERRALGRRALSEVGERAVVVLGRPYNLHDPLLNLDLSRRLRRLGLVAIPMDLLPSEEVVLGPDHSRMMWRYSRDQLRALELVRRDERLFPLWVSCFGCGLDAFAFKHFNELLGDRPALMLEFDEHRGEAGLVTRLEAFLDEIDEHLTAAKPAPRFKPIRQEPTPNGHVVIPNISEHAWASAGALRAAGWDAEVLPPPDEATLTAGEEAASGGECHPWVVMAGELVRWVRSGQARRGDVFYYPQATNPCLIGQYGAAHRRVLERLGVGDRYIICAIDAATLMGTFGGKTTLDMFEGIAAMDTLISAACARRPYERTPGTVHQLHQQTVQRVAAALAHGEGAFTATIEGLEQLMAVPIREDEHRPVVGVCGDLYTRINAWGNADLFKRLEALGCQVWAHSDLSGLVTGGTRLHMKRWVERGQLTPALREYVGTTGAAALLGELSRGIPEELAPWCLTPSPEQIRQLSEPYAGPRTNNLITENIGRIVDFAQNGADGVISAVGIGCMVGVAVDGAMRHIRRDYPHIPMVTLAYGCSEGPSQRIKLETFVHQVHDAAARRRRSL